MGATTRTVGASGATYTTIAAAIAASSAGDTILVAPGTYTESITYGVDNLTIKAMGSYLDTIITQTTATVVDFGTKEGCVLEGFKISLTGAGDAGAGFCIAGANDTSANVPNIIRNCYTSRTGSATAHNSISITDGDWEFHHCKMYTKHGNSMYSTFLISGGAIVKLWDCDLYSLEAAGSNSMINMHTSASTLYMYNCSVIHHYNAVTANVPSVIGLSAHAHKVYLYNNYIETINANTGVCKCLVIANGATVESYHNVYKAVSTATAEWANIASGGTLTSGGDNIIAGALTNAGTANIYSTTTVGDLYIAGNCSALTFTDRTPYYEGDALSEIALVKGKDGKVDHTTLPAFAKVEKKGMVEEIIDGKTVSKEKVVSEERDLGAMISMLTVAVQQLNEKVKVLENK
jgi:hypothetical protein